MVTYGKEAYSALYGNIIPSSMAGTRDKCISQCTGCKCNCSCSKCKFTEDSHEISEKEWEVL